MNRRNWLASIALVLTLPTLAAPIPRSLRLPLKFPDIRTASTETLAAWSKDQQGWVKLCRNQWPRDTIFVATVEQAIAEGTDLGEGYRYVMLLQIQVYLLEQP